MKVASFQCVVVSSDLEEQDRESLHSDVASPQFETMQGSRGPSDAREEPNAFGLAILGAGSPVTLPIVPPPLIPRTTPPPSVTVGPVEPECTQFVRNLQGAVTALPGEAIHDVGLALPNHSAISRDIVALPGVLACLLFNRAQIVEAGDIPRDVEPSKLLELSNKVMESLATAGLTARSAVQQFTFHGDSVAVTFFVPNAVSLCAILHARDLLPLVRKKIAAAVERIEASSRL